MDIVLIIVSAWASVSIHYGERACAPFAGPAQAGLKLIWAPGPDGSLTVDSRVSELEHEFKPVCGPVLLPRHPS